MCGALYLPKMVEAANWSRTRREGHNGETKCVKCKHVTLCLIDKEVVSNVPFMTCKHGSNVFITCFCTPKYYKYIKN